MYIHSTNQKYRHTCKDIQTYMYTRTYTHKQTTICLWNMRNMYISLPVSINDCTKSHSIFPAVCEVFYSHFIITICCSLCPLKKLFLNCSSRNLFGRSRRSDRSRRWPLTGNRVWWLLKSSRKLQERKDSIRCGLDIWTNVFSSKSKQQQDSYP